MIFPLRIRNRVVVSTDGFYVSSMRIQPLFGQTRIGFRVTFLNEKGAHMATAKVLPRAEDGVLIAEPSIGDPWVGVSTAGQSVKVERRDVIASRTGVALPWSLEVMNAMEVGIKRLME